MEWKSNVEEKKKTHKTFLANLLSALREALIQETLAVNKQKDMTHVARLPLFVMGSNRREGT